MIVVCPSCATHQDVPQSHLDDGRTFIRCGVCGQGWIENRAIEIVDALAYDEPAILIDETTESASADLEVMRLAEAAHIAEERFAQRQRLRRRERRGWAALALSVLIPVLTAATLPQQVAEAFPPAGRIYALAGVNVNVRGLEFRNVGQKHLLTDGTRVLGIQGEIVNVGSREQRIPTLKFILRDGTKQSVYEWTLNSSTRAIKPGETSTFVTRVASPPEPATEIEIRFTDG
jgi:hypothetical protein